MRPNPNGQARGQQQTRGVEGRPAVTPKTLAGQVEERLLTWKPQLIALFPKEGEAAYARAVTMAKDQARKMKPDTDPQSIVECAISAMKLDLEPGADCYFVPFKGKATFITGPQGLIKLMFRSGFVKSVTARYVLRSDEFDYTLGTAEHITHRRGSQRPVRPSEIWRDLVAAYAIVETTTGGRSIEVLERGDIEYFRSLSPSGNSDVGLWGKFPGEAARKAVLKQVAKLVPHSAQLSIAIHADADDRSYEVPDEMIAAAMRGSEDGGDVPDDEQEMAPETDEPAEREPGSEG